VTDPNVIATLSGVRSTLSARQGYIRTCEALSRLLARPMVFGSLIPIATILNALVGMLLPKLMAPRLFGEYSLVVTLFNHGLIFDFGVSQIIDREIPAKLGLGRNELARQIADRLLWVRLIIATATFVLVFAVLAMLARADRLPFGLTAGALATLAGLADMVALGPACIYRAKSQRRAYAVCIAILLSGLVFARLGGLIAGGLNGCFVALSVWYVSCGVWFHRTTPLRPSERPTRRQTASVIAQGLPFFATAIIWSFYVTENRWVASLLIPPEQFGQFAFSANIFSLLVGAAGGFSAFYYPKIVERIASGGAWSMSRALTRDLAAIVGITVVVVAVGVALAGIVVPVVYPGYADGIATMRIILVAVPPMVLASWLMPISLSVGNRPLIDGLLIFPAAAISLAIAMCLLHEHFGEPGAAWASTISALSLIAMQLLMLRRARILRAIDVGALFLFCVGGCFLVALLAWGTGA
jgi:O-antigen/teichoic acid export membrane protein